MISPPLHLKCEYLVNPICIDTKIPRFSWIVTHKQKNQFQSAYQVIVSSNKALSEAKKGDLWDSGKVESDLNVNIAYQGITLESDKNYFWRVKWWDIDGNRSNYSGINYFGTALLVKSDWKGNWITRKEFLHKKTRRSLQYKSGERMLTGRIRELHAIYLRKEFSMLKELESAKAFICGIGYYEFRLNGKKVGDRILEPAQTDYNKLALYSTYDITENLKTSNGVGIILGNGRCVEVFGYNYPKVIFQINLHYKDGTFDSICSDNSWKVSDGPIKENGIYYGEFYDARLEMPGWDSPNFNESGWKDAAITEGYSLASQMMHPIQITKILKPREINSPKPGIYVYDFGQNFTGFLKLKVSGPRGTEIKLRFSELLTDDGMLNMATIGGAHATDTYILKGEEVEVFEPHFTYHGFRFVELTGFPGVPSLDSLEAYFFHSNVPKVGEFHCSNELINQIHSNIIWAQLSNFMSIPTDCPQRDERHGWMGDAQLTTEEAIFNFDMARFYSKYVRDIRLSQREDGSLSDVVPPYWAIYPSDPAWGAAFMVLTWYVYWYYNDIRILEENYESLKKYVNFMSSTSKNNINEFGKYGDWCPPSSIASRRTPVNLTSTWYYYHDTFILSKIAKILNMDEDFKYFTYKAKEIRNAFNNEFFKGVTYFSYKLAPTDTSLSQTSNVLPLYLHMEPDKKRNGLVKALVQAIKNEYDYHFGTGIVGTRYICDVLTEEGYPDVAYKILTQKSFPGFGYMIREGATTLWERWEKLEGGGMNSHNHIMLGSIDTWFYNTLTGIKAVEAGWKTLRIKPYIPNNMEYATGTIDTIKGRISVSWEKIKNALKITVLIPIGVKAETWIPIEGSKSEIKENNKTIWKYDKFESENTDLSYQETIDNYVILNLGSGYYEFRIQN